jgi:hypothetical protein
VAGAALLLVVLNVVGVARYPGGPLREPNADGPLWLDIRPADQGSSGGGNWEPADWAQAGLPVWDGELDLHNTAPWPVTVETITPIDPTRGLVLDGVFVSRNGLTGVGSLGMGLASDVPLPPGQTFESTFTGLPASLGPGTESEVYVVVHADQPGSLGFAALDVAYRVGPFTFHAVQHLFMNVCLGPLPSDTFCPGAGVEPPPVQ